MTSTAPKSAQRVRLGPTQNGGFTVNGRLTRNPDREARGTGDMIRRMVRSLSRRAEHGDLQAIVELRKLDAVVALETLRAVHALNVGHGYSWAEIGLAAGMTRQAAHQRWGR